MGQAWRNPKSLDVKRPLLKRFSAAAETSGLGYIATQPLSGLPLWELRTRNPSLLLILIHLLILISYRLGQVLTTPDTELSP